MPDLQRITTEYVETEDRVRLSGEVDGGGTVVVWLTHRLLDRVADALVERIEQESAEMPRAEVMQSFAQQAAQAAIEPQAPVRPADESAAWLCVSVDVTPAESAVTLVFRGAAPEQEAALTLPWKALRQWLGILHFGYLKAGWPLDVWPTWMAQSDVSASEAGFTVH